MRTLSKGLKTKLFGLLAGIEHLRVRSFNPLRLWLSLFGASGTGNDGALSASAAFTTSAGPLSVTITNTAYCGSIRSAGQAVSDLSFTLSNAPGTLGATTATGTFATFMVRPQPTTVRAREPDPVAGQAAAKVISAL